ncbi:MAG: methyltransferase domain-containing protein, partial [Xanthomonadales bacterium]|nr:methyltransferase domain-containing protein [Xanthomonadales bacterium]
AQIDPDDTDAAGVAASLAERLGERAQAIALDLALPMLHAARAHRTWLRPFARVCADAQALPFADASIDLVYSNLCLQWCDDLDAALDGFRRVLRERGLVVFSTFGPDTLHELRLAYAEVDAASHVSRFLDIHQVGDALLAAGFRDPVLERESFTLTYTDALTLMRELRAIGATHADPARARGLAGKQHLKDVIAAYEAFREDGRLPATYEVVYAIARAPEPGQPRRSRDGAIASIPLDRLRGTRRQR